MNLLKLIPLSLVGLTSITQATLVSDKITLKPSMAVRYTQLPSSVNSLSDIFKDGMFYGRLRSNMFRWDWNDEASLDHKAMGIGASLVYKTAPYSGWSSTIGLYTSQNPAWYNEDVADVGSVKAGKDTFSRYDTDKTGNFGMNVLGQAYLQYSVGKTNFILGRQMFESVFTKSNDTKMIPNTFDGLTATIKELDKTTIKLAYLAKQKLRDHTSAHDVIAYNDWEENDDSGVNKNLTVDLIGNNNSLIIATLSNRSIKNLKLNVNYAIIPSVVSNLTLESHYKIPLTKEWNVTPGARYMQQFDGLSDARHAQAMSQTGGVANLGAKSAEYTNPNSLDTNLVALRIDLKTKVFMARVGYSKIADKADIITPWRGFPTGGFTRAMGQYNWYANTETYLARVGYNFSKAGIIDGFSIMAQYAIQDFDDKKIDGAQADTNILHIDARQNIGENLEAKIRLGFVSDEDTSGVKDDVSYNEYRFELNYFF